jgi:flavorubredoxin
LHHGEIDRPGRLRARQAAFVRSRLSSNSNVADNTPDVSRYKAINIGAPVEDSAINPDVRAAAPFRTLAVQFAHRAAAVLGAFSWGEQIRLGHNFASPCRSLRRMTRT